MKDIKSPWYLQFDHWIPRDSKKVVITSTLINEMKSDQSEEEFWDFVIQLDNYKKKHIKIKTGPLVYWYRLHPPIVSPLKTPKKQSSQCVICGNPVFSTYSKYCKICSNFEIRLKSKSFPRKTVSDVWQYVRQNGYVCYYTGMPLNMLDRHNPWYCVLSPLKPNDPKKVVITTYLLFVMKSKLSEKEFWSFIDQLAKHKKQGTKVKKFNPRYWS